MSARARSFPLRRLIHGGLRYLAQAFQAKLPPNSLLEVFINLRYRHEYMKILNADLYERKYMIDSAAFMTRPLPIMVPMYRWWEVRVYADALNPLCLTLLQPTPTPTPTPTPPPRVHASTD
eukprot:1108702-Pleurochrysis_carterae.AAC.1